MFLNNLFKFVGIVIVVIVVAIFLNQLFNGPSPTESAVEISCGGIVGTKCPVGMHCVYPKAPYPDETGTCQPGSGENSFVFANDVYVAAKQTYTIIRDEIRMIIFNIWEKISPGPEADPNYGV